MDLILHFNIHLKQHLNFTTGVLLVIQPDNRLSALYLQLLLNLLSQIVLLDLKKEKNNDSTFPKHTHTYTHAIPGIERPYLSRDGQRKAIHKHHIVGDLEVRDLKGK